LVPLRGLQYVSFPLVSSTSIADPLTDNPNWDPETFNRLDAKAAADQNPFNVQTWNGNLSDFQAAGGKLREFLHKPEHNR
jgi:hypothetical protein